MGFSYYTRDHVPASVVTPAVAVLPPEDERAALLREAEQLKAEIPAHYDALLQDASLSPKERVDAVRALVALNRQPEIKESDVATACPAIRAAAEALKKEKEDMIRREREAALAMAVAALAAIRAAAGAAQTPWTAISVPEQEAQPLTMAAALDFVCATGPGNTPTGCRPVASSILTA